MSLQGFLQENYVKLNQDNGDGFGKRLFVPFKKPLGEHAEKYANRIAEKYILNKDIFSEPKLSRTFINEIKYVLAELDIEILSTAIELGLKLTVKEMTSLKSAYQFAFISRLNQLTEDAKFSHKSAQRLGLMEVVRKIGELLLQNKEADELISQARESFNKVKELIRLNMSTSSQNAKIQHKDRQAKSFHGDLSSIVSKVPVSKSKFRFSWASGDKKSTPSQTPASVLKKSP